MEDMGESEARKRLDFVASEKLKRRMSKILSSFINIYIGNSLFVPFLAALVQEECPRGGLNNRQYTENESFTLSVTAKHSS